MSIPWLKWFTFLKKDWLQKLQGIAVCMILLQYVSLFQEIWWPETVSMVTAILLVSMVVEWFTRLTKVWRLAIHIALMLVICGFYADFHWFFLSEGNLSLQTVFILLKFHILQFHPLIWFATGAVIALLGGLIWVRDRTRIMILLLFSVLFFSVIDSFSRYLLWDQVAWVILGGMMLLVAQHFAYFKLKYPASWSYLADYPGMIAAPIAILLVLIMAAGYFAPNLPPLITDPYTAWKNMQGEQVVTSGKGFAGTLPRGNNLSGYGRDNLTLGGGFDYNYEPVMTVDTDQKSYYRGETRSFYNGKGWELSETEHRTAEVSIAPEIPLAHDFAPETQKLKTVEARQTITMIRKDVYPVLFSAYSTSKVSGIMLDDNPSMTALADKMAWSPHQEEIRWKDTKEYPQTYTVVSQIPVIDEQGLRTAEANFAGKPEWNPYLQLPGSLPDRVKQLALEVTKDAPTPYDKVKKLAEYLQTSYPYTNKPDLSKTQSKDFVDGFLFELQEGYCDYYSTALAVLTRTLGIPSRWVKGFTAGILPYDEYEIPMQIAEKMDISQGTFTVRNADAHSWVEVYFEGWGWIPFESTSGFTLPQVSVQTALDSLAADIDMNEAEAEETRKFSSLWIYVLVAVGLLFAAVLFIGVLYLRRSEIRSVLAGYMNRKEMNLDRKIVGDFARWVRFARRKGYVRKEYETARETLSRWGSESRWLKKELEVLLNIYEKAKYSPNQISQEEADRMIRTLKKLREQM